MPAHGKGQQVRRLTANGILVGLLALAAIPGYLAVEPAWRPLVVRLACAAAVAVACVRLSRWVGEAMDAYSPSLLDAARPQPTPPALDPRFLRLRDHLTQSVRSQRYFTAVLWPRLRALARGPLAEPAPRRWLRRLGPSRAALQDLIAEIEKRG
jgi:hypothetical protein